MNVVHPPVSLKEWFCVFGKQHSRDAGNCETAEERDWDLQPWCPKETCIEMRSSAEQLR